MNSKRKRALLFAVNALMMAALACNLPNGDTPTETPTPVTEVSDADLTETAEGITETPTETPEVTPTNTPDTSEDGGDTDISESGVESGDDCTLNGTYVSDVTVPDNTEFAPGTGFTKTWRMRNSGTCNWETGTLLVYVSGDTMSGPASVSVSVVAPGSTSDISVDFTAPASPGTYRSNWQLQSPEGVRYGSTIYVQIIVPWPPDEEEDLPDLVISDLRLNTADPQADVPLTIIARLQNNGDASVHCFLVDCFVLFNTERNISESVNALGDDFVDYADLRRGVTLGGATEIGGSAGLICPFQNTLLQAGEPVRAN